MRSRFLQTLAALAVAAFATSAAWADNPGRHPYYLHALTDLRMARAYLEHFSSDPVDQQENYAIGNIDKALDEIKAAAIADGKNIQDHVPVDVHMNRRDRYNKALELLEKAKHDVSGEEDQPDTRGLQAGVIRHIDDAKHSVRAAIDNAHWQ